MKYRFVVWLPMSDVGRDDIDWKDVALLPAELRRAQDRVATYQGERRNP